jgi:hypothetical protein
VQSDTDNLETSKVKNTVNPSSAAFIKNGELITDYPSGCLRKLLISAYLTEKKEIDQIYQDVGRLNEDRYEAQLYNDQPWPYHKEKAFKVPEPFGINPDIMLSGRCDFITYEDTGMVVHECKGSIGRAAKDAIMYGIVKTGHLAQLVFYLTVFKITRGILSVGLYTPRLKFVAARDFDITLNAQGKVLVDGAECGFNVKDQLQHQLKSVETLDQEAMASRLAPNVCKYCDYVGICNQYDMFGGDVLDIIIEKSGGNYV